MSIEKDALLPLMASHICHELASPITGISNALSMVQEELARLPKSQAQEFLANSVNSAHYLVQMLRQAYGNPTLGEGVYDMRLAEELCRHFVSDRNRSPEMVWNLDGFECAPREARVLLSMVMLVSGFLPRGGTVTVNGTASAGQLEWSVAAEGSRVMIRDEIRAALRGESTPDRPPSTWIGAYYLFSLVSAAGAELAAREAEGRIEMIVRMGRL